MDQLMHGSWTHLIIPLNCDLIAGKTDTEGLGHHIFHQVSCNILETFPEINRKKCSLESSELPVSFIGDDSQLFQVRAFQNVHENSTKIYPCGSQFRHVTIDNISEMIDQITGIFNR